MDKSLLAMMHGSCMAEGKCLDVHWALRTGKPAGIGVLSGKALLGLMCWLGLRWSWLGCLLEADEASQKKEMS